MWRAAWHCCGQAVEPETRRRGPLYAQTWLWLGGRRPDRRAGGGGTRGGADGARNGGGVQGERGHLGWAERILPGDLLAASDPGAAAWHYEQALEIAAELGMHLQAELAREGLARSIVARSTRPV